MNKQSGDSIDMASCSFCGRTEDSVEKLVSGPSAFICDKCVRLCMEIVEKKTVKHEFVLLKPIEIKKRLDNYIIGQEKAKKTISVAVYNHYKRIRSISQESQEMEYSKSNVLLLGPTGSGKTLIARTLANILDVPFAIADATTLTEAGYVGEDVENIILRLVQNADYDIARAEQGIIYIDEIDKVRKTTGNVSITRDVSGEGVQQSLLKIVEGTVANVPPKGGRKHPNQEYIKVNTENILFIVGGAFVHLDEIVAKRLGKGIIGFTNQTEKKDFDTTEKNYLLSKVETEDLVKFGLIPEFIGRFNSMANCNELTIEDLVTILVKPKNAILKQYAALFLEDGVQLTFTEKALKAIGAKAKQSDTGARALRMIIENLLMDLMYEVPSDATIKEVVIEEGCVTEDAPPTIKHKEDKKEAG